MTFRNLRTYRAPLRHITDHLYADSQMLQVINYSSPTQLPTETPCIVIGLQEGFFP